MSERSAGEPTTVLVTPLGARAPHSANIGDQDRFLAFAMCSADVLLELDSDKVIVYLAGAIAANLGEPATALIGREFMSVLAEQDEFMVTEILDRMVEYGQMEETLIRMKLRVEGGRPHKLILSGYHLPHLDGHYFLTLRKQFAKAIDVDSEDAERDTESGMLTGDSFIDLAGERLEALNADGEHFQMATVELEDAALLRERLDEGGRKRLKQMIGAALRANSVGGDMAGDLGDDRYALIHDRTLDLVALEKRIMEQAKALDPLGIGLAVRAAQVAVGSRGMSEDDATRALIYAIKQLDVGGQSITQLSDLSASLSGIVADTARRMADVRAVIDAGKFNTVFQPVVKLRGYEPHHYEALARFDRGAINLPPFEVIRLAEDVGLVAEFDLATCRRCLEHLVGDARAKSDLPIAVNLSGRSLSTPAFIQELDHLLEAFAAVRKRLLIEITETVRLKDFTMARNYITKLRQAGHKVCLDDFGAGEMQIDYLRQLEVDFVKIDGSYILGARKDSTNKVLLKAVTSLCKELRIATIAEMVEDQDQVPFLQECHVLLGQGWLFGRPMDVPQMIYAKALKEEEAKKAAAERAAAEQRAAAEKAAAGLAAVEPGQGMLRGNSSPFQTAAGAALDTRLGGLRGAGGGPTTMAPLAAALRGSQPGMHAPAGEAQMRGSHDAGMAMPMAGRAAFWNGQTQQGGPGVGEADWGTQAGGTKAVATAAAWGQAGSAAAGSAAQHGAEATWGQPSPTGARPAAGIEASWGQPAAGVAHPTAEGAHPAAGGTHPTAGGPQPKSSGTPDSLWAPIGGDGHAPGGRVVTRADAAAVPGAVSGATAGAVSGAVSGTAPGAAAGAPLGTGLKVLMPATSDLPGQPAVSASTTMISSKAIPVRPARKLGSEVSWG